MKRPLLTEYETLWKPLFTSTVLPKAVFSISNLTHYMYCGNTGHSMQITRLLSNNFGSSVCLLNEKVFQTNNYTVLSMNCQEINWYKKLYSSYKRTESVCMRFEAKCFNTQFLTCFTGLVVSLLLLNSQFWSQLFFFLVLSLARLYFFFLATDFAFDVTAPMKLASTLAVHHDMVRVVPSSTTHHFAAVFPLGCSVTLSALRPRDPGLLVS